MDCGEVLSLLGAPYEVANLCQKDRGLANTSTRLNSAVLNCLMAMPILQAGTLASSTRLARMSSFFHRNMSLTAGVMYSGSADVMVTVC